MPIPSTIQTPYSRFEFTLSCHSTLPAPVISWFASRSAWQQKISKKPCTMNEICRVLDVWSSISNQLRVRDKSVKVLQYGCQMMLGFYANKFSESTIEMLKLTRRTASTSRKAFWLFKSVNHVHSILNMTKSIMAEFSWVLLLDLVEQVFLAIYYFTENLVFFIRVKVLNMNEAELDPYVNFSWFVGDFVCFAAAILRLCTSFIECYHDTAPVDDKRLQRFRKMCTDIVATLIVSRIVSNELLSAVIANCYALHRRPLNSWFRLIIWRYLSRRVE